MLVSLLTLTTYSAQGGAQRMKTRYILIPLLLVILPAGCASSIMTGNDSNIAEVRNKFEGEVMSMGGGSDGFNPDYEFCRRATLEGRGGGCSSIDIEDPSSIFGGSLDAIVEERDRVLNAKGVIFLGSWSTGSSTGGRFDNPMTWGIYIPLYPCRLDSLPGAIRERIC